MNGFPFIAIRGSDDLLLGLDDDGFQVLAATNTAGSASAAGAVIFIDPAGKFD